MARVTVEDCVEKVNSRFDLVLLAAQRARQLSAGMETKLERENDKSPIIALREIAASAVDIKELQKQLLKSMQTHAEAPTAEKEESEEDELLRMLTEKLSDDDDDDEEAGDIIDFDDDEIFAKAFEELADSLPDDLDDDLKIEINKE